MRGSVVFKHLVLSYTWVFTDRERERERSLKKKHPVLV